MLRLCDLHVFLHVCLRLHVISGYYTTNNVWPRFAIKKMRTQISCNTTWKINLRNGFLGGFLHSYTFHSAERLCATLFSLVQKALICQT